MHRADKPGCVQAIFYVYGLLNLKVKIYEKYKKIIFSCDRYVILNI